MKKHTTMIKNVSFYISIAVMAVVFNSCTETVIEPEIKINGEPSAILDFEGKAGSKTITVFSTMDWSVSNIPDWITLVPSSGTEGTSNVIVTVKEISEGGSREASLDFKIDNSTQAALTVKNNTEVILKASQNSFAMPAEGGEVKFAISANTPWTLGLKDEGNSKYIESISAESGTDSQEITIVLKKNDTVDPLNITFVLASSSSSITPKTEEEIQISQAADSVRLAPESETVYAPKEGGEIKFGISANVSWTLELENPEDSQYIEDFSPKSGSGDSEISVIFKENHNTEPIVFGMILSSDDPRVSPAIKKEITLSQSNNIPILTVDSTEFNISGEGGSATFNITSNTAWAIVLSDEKQIAHIENISHPAGEGDREITITFKANPDVSVINIGIEVNSTDPSVVPPISRELKFVHAGGEVRMDVGVNQLSVSGLGGGVSFNISSNIKWTVAVKNSADQKYVESITPSSSSGDGRVTINVNENTMEDPVDFIILVKSDDNNVNPPMEHEITVKQNAGVPPGIPSGIKVAASFEYAELSWDEIPRATGYELDVNGQVVVLDTNSYKCAGLLPGEWYSYRIRSVRYNLYSLWADGGFGTADVYPNENWPGTWSGNLSSLKLRSTTFGELDIWAILNSTPDPAVNMAISAHPSVSYKAVVTLSGGFSEVFPSSALSNFAVINSGTQLTETAASTERVNITINKLITDIPEIMSQLTGDEIKAIIGIKLQTIYFNTKSVTFLGQLLGSNQAYTVLTAKGDVTVSLSGGDSSARSQLAAKIQELLKDTDYTLTIPNMYK